MAQTKVGSGFVATGAVGPTSLSTGAPYWDTSGNVGVGTSSPNYQLQLYKGGAVANYLQVTSGATGTGAANGTLFGVDASGNGIVTVQGAVNYITSVAGVERMRIDSSGNVGIGTNSPSAKLHSYATSGTTTTLGKFEAAIGSYTGTSLIAANTLTDSSTYNLFSCITDSDGDAGGPYTKFLVRGDGNVGIGTSSPSYRLDAISSGGTQTARFRSGDTATSVDIASFERSDSAVRAVINYNSSDGTMTYGTSTNHPIGFKTNNSERMRIDSSGRLLVGTTTAAGSANTFCSTAGAVQQALSFWNTATAGTRYMCTFGDSASYTERGNINWNGTTMTLATTSDRRLKTNIEPAIGGLEKVLATNVYSYDMHGGHSEFGVIAQEMIDVLPASVCVGEDNEDGSIKRPWSVGYEPMVPMLIKAIQELKAELDALKAKVGS